MVNKSRKRILVVDDDVVLRETIRECVEKEGYEPLLATDGRWALQIIKNEPLDLVISDISMPDIDGMELLQTLRERSNLPVIMMTAFAADTEVKRAKALGVSAFMHKPFRCSQLMVEVNKILK